MKLWNRNFIMAFATNIIFANGFYLFMTVVPLYGINVLKLGESKIGLIMGAFAISAVASRPFAGACLQSVRRMQVYVPAVIAFILCSLSYGIAAGGFLSLFLIRLAHGVAWGAYSTAGNTIAADLVPKERRAEGLGYYAITMTLGMALGPALGVILLDSAHFSHRAVFFVTFAIVLFGGILGLTIRPPLQPTIKFRMSIDSLFERRALGLGLMQLLYGFAYGSVMIFIVAYGKSLGIVHSSFFFLIFAGVMTVTRPYIGKHVDKYGTVYAVIVGFIAVMAAFIALYMAKGATLFFAAALLLGIGSGTVMPLLMTMSMNVVPPARRGVANATIFSAFDLGVGSGSIFLGLLAEKTSMAHMYMVAAVVSILPLIYYFLVEHKRYIRFSSEQR